MSIFEELWAAKAGDAISSMCFRPDQAPSDTRKLQLHLVKILARIHPLLPRASRLFLLFLALCCGSQLCALTLDQALREALAAHPLLAVSQSRIESAEGKSMQARLRPNPLFVYQSEDFRTWESPGHRFWQESDHFFYLQQTFETASKRARRMDLAKANENRAAIELLAQKQQIAARVRNAFWDAFGAQERAERLGKLRDGFEELLEYHRVQVQEGLMAEADLIRVRLEAEKLSLLQSAARVELQRQLVRLQREMGRSEISDFRLEGEFTLLPAPAPETISSAFERRAEVKLAEQIIAVAAAQVALETAAAKPNVDGVYGYKRSKEFDTVMWGFQTQLPLFNKNEGNIASATAESRLARQAIVVTKALVKAEFEGSRRELELRRTQLEGSLRQLRDHARQTLEIAQSAYKLGGADLLRLLDAQRQLLDVEQLYLDAQVACQQAQAGVEAAMGVLP